MWEGAKINPVPSVEHLTAEIRRPLLVAHVIAQINSKPFLAHSNSARPTSSFPLKTSLCSHWTTECWSLRRRRPAGIAELSVGLFLFNQRRFKGENCNNIVEADIVATTLQAFRTLDLLCLRCGLPTSLVCSSRRSSIIPDVKVQVLSTLVGFYLHSFFLVCFFFSYWTVVEIFVWSTSLSSEPFTSIVIFIKRPCTMNNY